MIWFLAYTTAACFVSMLVVILAAAAALKKADRRYGRLLAKHTILRGELEESRELVIPRWVNAQPRVPVKHPIHERRG